ncbi:MAG: glycosyltransferase family 4 protein [Candidatus Scalindua sp.]
MKKGKYNILFLDIFSHIGGAEASLLLLLKHIDKTKFNPVCVIPETGPLYERIKILKIKVEIIPLKTINFPFILGYLRTVWQLTRLIKKRRIDLVVCNLEICNQFGLPAAVFNRIPIVCHTRAQVHDLILYWKMLLPFPSVFIANSHATARSFASYLRKGQNVVVVHNGIDLNEYSLTISGHPIRREYGIDDDAFLISVVGRINRTEKRQDVFIKAMAEVVKVCPDVCAIIVGDTKIDRSEDYLEELNQMVNNLGLEDRVIFTGFISDMREVYAALNLLVLTSREEPFGRVLIEAMAMGKPVVATRSGGAIEVVDQGVTGFLVPPDDVKAMSESIIKLVQDKNAANEMGNAGRTRVEKLFSIEKNVKKTEGIYCSVVSIS